MHKIQDAARKLREWRAFRFAQALLQIEDTFVNIHKNRSATWQQCRAATKEYGRIIVFHPDFYFLVIGMGLLVFVTRSFTQPGIDYGPWRPVVVGLASLFAGAIPVVVSLVLYPLHIFLKVSTWAIAALNIVISANLFALIEPVIPSIFYSEGVLGYQDLIFGILVFYTLALGYLQLRLNQYYCLHCFTKRHEQRDLNNLIPADIRGPIVALSAKDHHVAITTEYGQHINRMSMKEAMGMLPEDTGIQVHRSHWVSYKAMLILEKTAGRQVLTLRNGEQVPVSKAKVSEVLSSLNKP